MCQVLDGDSSARRAALLEVRGTESKNASFLGFWTSPGNCSRPSRERTICSLHASTGNLNGPQARPTKHLQLDQRLRENRGSSKGPTTGLALLGPAPSCPANSNASYPSRPGPARPKAELPAPPLPRSSLGPGQWPRGSPRPAPPSSSGRVLQGCMRVNLLPSLVSSR